MTPFFGFHLLLCLAVAATLRLNKIVLALAANVSLPPFVPLVAVVCIQTGHYALHRRFAALDAAGVEELRHSFFVDWLAGAALAGGVLGGGLGLATTLIAGRCEPGRPGDGLGAPRYRPFGEP